jgi:hypothetical protein
VTLMRMIFLNWAFQDHGSAQDLSNYVQVGRALGHDIALYGRGGVGGGLDGSLDVASADAVVFIFEYSTYVEALDALRLVGSVPRERRVVLDCDGGYNDAISVNGDVNHADADASRHWVEVCDSLSDKIFQPTLHPLRPNVGSFFFHAYNPAWERPLDFSTKPYELCYVGNNWFRWRALRRVLDAIEPVRTKVGRLALVGNGWNSPAPWSNPSIDEDAYFTDPGYLRDLDVEVLAPVAFDRVIDHMGLGVVSPVIYRPLFDHLRLVTCRTFETPAANTIPLFAQDPAFVAEIYGEEALALVLPDDQPEDKILDLISRPDHYAPIVTRIRRRLAQRYSYTTRLHELVEIVTE